MEKLREQPNVEKEIEHYIFNWHSFPIDYWWRKKYNVPFGSRQHREQNFIDMLIEYQEEIVLNNVRAEIDREKEEKENEALGLSNKKMNEAKLTEKELDDAYENLDLSQFDKV